MLPSTEPKSESHASGTSEQFETGSDVMADEISEHPLSEDFERHTISTSPRPMLIKSLLNAEEGDGSQILEDLKKSLPLRLPMKAANEFGDKAEPQVVLDTSVKGTGMVLSDFTSESSTKSEFEPQSKYTFHERLKVCNWVFLGIPICYTIAYAQKSKILIHKCERNRLIVITFYSPSYLGQETAKGAFWSSSQAATCPFLSYFLPGLFDWNHINKWVKVSKLFRWFTVAKIEI